MLIETGVSDTVEKAEYMVVLLLDVFLQKDRIFHNLQHTREVVQSVELLCDQLGVSEEEREIVLVAAWFHDTGHLKQYEGHEKASPL